MTALLARALPLLNKAIPMGLASQGLSKIDPRLKNFIQSSIASGYSLDTIMDYIRNKSQGKKTPAEQRTEQGIARPDEMASSSRLQQGRQPADILQGLATAGAAGLGGYLGMGDSEQPEQSIQPSEILSQDQQPPMLGQRQQMQQLQGPPPEEPFQSPQGPINMPSKGSSPMVGNILNLLDSYSPLLADVVRSQMSQGADPSELTKFLKQPKQFKNPIEMIEKDTAQSFEKLLSSLMEFKKPKTREEALGAFRQQMMNRNAMQKQTQQPIAQQSAGDQALMGAIQKILSM